MEVIGSVTYSLIALVGAVRLLHILGDSSQEDMRVKEVKDRTWHHAVPIANGVAISSHARTTLLHPCSEVHMSKWGTLLYV
eukprot:889580-Amphidinium_carterae.1